MDPTVSIVIATRNRKHTVLCILRSIARQRYDSGLLEAIVVDDNSDDGLPDAIRARQWPMRVQVVPSGRPKETHNYHASVNVGLAQVTGEFVLFLDSDMVLARGAIRALVDRQREAAASGGSVAVRGWWKDAHGFRFSRRRLLIDRYRYTRDIGRNAKLDRLLAGADDLAPDACPSCYLFTATEDARAVGGFPGEFTVYGKDGIFQHKLRQERDTRFVFCPDAYGLHRPLWGDDDGKRYKKTRGKG